MKTDTSKDSTRLEVTNLKDDLKVPESPEDWIEYYSHVKKTLDVDIDFFIDASDDMVISGKEQIKNVNNRLWEIEDNIRIKETKQEFDEEFINLARLVYKTNDERYSIKTMINKKFNSVIQEIKSYKKSN